ncbi:MAG: FAD-dependent oxidoreductase [Smithellaceae bacterium]|nr:FAD-dependent oxidoreductase [Smithellaceae bacterium]
MSCIIVGGGIAGFQAALSCRAKWPDKAVTIIDAEGETGYYRTLLPQFMTGTVTEEQLFFWKGTTDPLLTVRSGLRVVSLDRENRTLGLSNGESISYERLVIAQGGEPLLPGQLAGPPGEGIFTLRDLTTARKAKAWLETHRKVLVFGGSLVGVKTAIHLRQAGYEVTMVIRRGHILLRALSSEAACVVEEHLRQMGITLCLNAPLEDIRIEGGAITAIQAGGEWHTCDTLLVAAGIAPDRDFLKGSGLLSGGELVVSTALQTLDKHIFAAGDGAVINRGTEQFSPNTWPQAMAQGRLAGENLYAASPTTHRDMTSVNAMELHGLSMVILGPPVAGAEIIAYERPAENVRRELFLVGGKPIGGALIGDISAGGTLRALIGAGREIHPGEASLLKPRAYSVIRFREQSGRRQPLLLAP